MPITELDRMLQGYATQLEKRHPTVTADELAIGDRAPTAASRRGRSHRMSVTATDSRGVRYRLAVASAAVILLGVVSLVAVARRASDGEPSDEDVVAAPHLLGVFEPLRGQILFTHGNGLGLVDPDDPAGEVTELTIDSLADMSTCEASGQCPTNVEPVGWSADGTLLAFVDEGGGGSYLLDSTGAISLVESDGGCCTFTSTNWLAPDGRSGAMLGGTSLRVVDLASRATVAAVELDESRFPGSPDFGQVYFPTWSPDGAQVAFVVAWQRDGVWEMLIQVLDVATGSVRDLPTPALTEFRGLAWSPDGTRLLAVATDGRWSDAALNNPLAQPRPAGLYVVGLDGSEPELVDEGHYIAAVWSPDGSRIAAIDFPVRHQLVVINADGTNRREVTVAARGLHNGLAWYPLH